MSLAPHLSPGDLVAAFSPSAPAANLFPHRVERGRARLDAIGFQTRLAPHALGNAGYLAGSAEERAADLNALLADPEVRAIISTIGGDHSCQLLPLVDWELARRDPKIIMGYSDMTVLLIAFWRMTGLVTFYGPHLMTELAEYPNMPAFSERAMLRALCDPTPPGQLPESDWWTDEFLDWSDQTDLTRQRERRPTPGWTWLKPGDASGERPAEGTLIGGCLESLQHLRGTPYWPDWRDTIMFFELSEEKPSPATVDGILMDYDNMGVLRGLRGMLVGRPYDYADTDRQGLRDVLLERTRQYDFPIVCDMDFGHTSPMLTLPIGGRVRIEPALRRVSIHDPCIA
jgi:muramoyltetrapeptide carboxypeptidase LdcA involved in peptidoglycan recycling